MGKHLVIAGGGHAHMLTLANLHKFIEKGHKVTLIGPSPYHYYSGMGPGMLGKTYNPEEVRFATKQVVEKQGGVFMQDRVNRVNPENRTVYLDSGQTITYDVLSCNVGSYVPMTIVSGTDTDIFPVKPIELLMHVQERMLELTLQKNISIGIIGGGPSSAETAGNIWRLGKYYGKNIPVITIFSGEKFMEHFPENVRNRIFRSLTKRGIEILENDFVREVKTGQIVMESGQKHFVDLILLAHGIKTYPVFQKSGLPTGPEGELLVNKYLQCTAHAEIFGGGDCIYFTDKPLDKVGVYAVRENPVLYHNLMASLDETELHTFDPGGEYLLIFNMGDGTGVLRKKKMVIGGRLAFIIKNYIDRRFMKKFQSQE
ncbi:NADH dehydrogenase, FAD-containing subunit [Candidatus Scalindua japonica]|uniref:NADH dehydrogenase, FAD-containing subunit n=1 Tax=Candidatus Scalindua japonica TaxID=1284222 RepID=A0A286TZY5_9BACT|nr:FAD-dependent oxidoreductase [Candidatus Scalindua japonica]GAX61450.1 NADH dehydrogenase, FAD-containing subunit [Candidatus Scalindua japonica]